MRGLAIVTALFGALTAAGCNFEAEYNDVAYRCGEDGQCPPGYSCVAGFSCELRQPCGTTALLADEFGSADIDDDLWGFWGNAELLPLSQEGGRIQFNVRGAPAPEGSVSAGIYSRHRYRLEASSLAAQIVLDGPESPIVFFFRARVRDGFEWLMRYNRGNLELSHITGGDYSLIARLEYSPEEHRWWRLREANGLVHFETSPNGEFWKTHGSASSTPYQNELVDLAMWAEFFWDRVPPASVTVEHVNRGVLAEVPWCPGAELRDDFASEAHEPEWHDEERNCSITQSEGQVTFDLNADGECAYVSSTFYDMTASAAAVEVGSPGSAGSTLSYAMLATSGDEARFLLREGMLTCTSTIGGVGSTEAEVAFDASLHRYWRVRGEGETIYWEVSGDAVTWTVLAERRDTGASLSEVYFRLGASADATYPAESESPGFAGINVTESGLLSR